MNSHSSNPPTVFRDRVEPADVDAVAALVEATGFFSDEEVKIAAELVAETLDRGAEAGYEFLFADEGGRVVGYSCFGRIPCSTVSWDLYWIAVHPDTQGTGLGKRLLKETEDRIRRAGGLAVYAETSGRPQYLPTRAFYDKTGYATAGVFDDFYAPDDAKYVFCKRLDRGVG